MRITTQSFTRRHALAAIAAASVGPLWAQTAANSTGDIVIGQTAQLSGPLAPSFVAVLKGQELALNEFHARGGLNGRRVKLITLDDAYDTQRCIANVSTLIDEHQVTALFGLASTAGIAGAFPLLAEKKVPLIGIYSGSPSLRTKQHPYFFTTTASYRDEVVQMLRNQAMLLRTRVGLVYNDSAFGKLMLPVVVEVAQELGISIVARASLDMSGSDAAAAAQAMTVGQPQAIVMMAFGPSILPFVKAARAQVGVPIFCPGIANSKQLIAALGDEARGLAFSVVTPYPFSATLPISRDFGKVMANAKLPPDYDHFFGYLNMRTLLAVLERAGKSVSPQGLVSTLERMTDVDVGGYKLNFSASNHHGSKFVETVIMGPHGRYIR